MKKVSMAFVALLLCFCFLLASCSDNAKMRELESENAALKEQLSKSSQTSPSSSSTSSTSSPSSTPSSSSTSSDQGVQLHDDQYVTISFLGCEKGKYDEELVFQIVNKTNVELTFQSGSMALDGESLGHVSGSETVAAQSRGKVRFSTEEAFPTFSPNTISGNIAVIDFSKTIFENNKQSYDVDFVNVSLQ